MTAGHTVVSGLGIVCSIAGDVASFQEALRAGRSGIRVNVDGTPPPHFHAPLRDFDLADAVACAPADLRRRALRLASRSPRPVRVALAAAVEAWCSALLHEHPPPDDRIGIVVAGHNLTSRYAYERAQGFAVAPEHLTPRFALHALDTDHVATISHVLGIRGEGLAVGGASASGTLGLIAGSRLVECGAVDACLVVGALTELTPMDARALAAIGAMAVEAPGAPFGERRNGFVPGEGAACVVVESAKSIRERGATSMATLGGYAQRLAATSLADPSVDAEASVMRAAIARAGLTPSEIGYVSAHATGSLAGDAAEAAALSDVFAGISPPPLVNATKALAGHCLSAAGIVAAVATVLQLRGGFSHANPGLGRSLDCACDLVGNRAVPARAGAALANGFGFGGFNACVALALPRSIDAQ